MFNEMKILWCKNYNCAECVVILRSGQASGDSLGQCTNISGNVVCFSVCFMGI